MGDNEVDTNISNPMNSTFTYGDNGEKNVGDGEKVGEKNVEDGEKVGDGEEEQNVQQVQQSVVNTPSSAHTTSSAHTLSSHDIIDKELEELMKVNPDDPPQYSFVVLSLGGRIETNTASFIVDMISDTAGVFSIVLKSISILLEYASSMSKLYQLTTNYEKILKDLQKNVELMKILYAIINSLEHTQINERLGAFTHTNHPTEEEFNQIFMIPKEITNIIEYLEEINTVITMYVFPKTVYDTTLPVGALISSNVELIMSEINEIFGLITLSYSLANTQFISTLSIYTANQIKAGKLDFNDKIREVLNKLAEGNHFKEQEISKNYDKNMKLFKEAVDSDAELKRIYNNLLSLGVEAKNNNLIDFYNEKMSKIYKMILNNKYSGQQVFTFDKGKRINTPDEDILSKDINGNFRKCYK
jgi:hypothetical protein